MCQESYVLSLIQSLTNASSLAMGLMVSLAIVYGIQRVDPFSVAVSDVVFNETKMHRKLVKEVEYRKVTFGDVNPPMQTALEPLILHVQRATSDVASTSQSRRSQRVSNPPDRFTLGVDFVLLTDSGEPSCYKEAMLAGDKS